MPVVEALSAPIGAYIHDIDLTCLTAEDTGFIQDSLREHLVLFFRDQALNPDRLYQLARKFGLPVPYPYVAGLPEHPEVVEVIKQPDETVNFGGVWHSDTAYLRQPASAALLYGVEIPKHGGDTMFTNMYTVYESLSPGLQRYLSLQKAVNDADNVAIAATRPAGQKKNLNAEHPVVRVHPETGRPLLYVNRAHTTRFANMTHDESRDLLNFLFDRIEQPEFSCRFQWEPGSLAFWDNRACQHYPINDYHGHQRRMLRISLAGDEPKGTSE